MNKWIGGALALAALIVGGLLYGWKGVILALSALMFWLLMQFTRLMRVMRMANSSPVGHVDSAVMLNARLRPGMRLMELIPLTRSLGRKFEGRAETYVWTDAGGVSVEVQMQQGQVQSWRLQRPADS
ncbi:hypothetical protein [Paucibacter soli]|uniref:hypothetical protein n=1 Tax=Paucibacter soli TaxID=3133433 RepID=UPI0030A0AD3A